MSVSRSDVDRIAALAHLELSDEEAARLVTELTGILDHVGALGDAEAPGDVPEAPPQTLRPTDDRTPDPLLRPPSAFAPDWRDGFFVVPRLPALGREEGDG